VTLIRADNSRREGSLLHLEEILCLAEICEDSLKDWGIFLHDNETSGLENIQKGSVEFLIVHWVRLVVTGCVCVWETSYGLSPFVHGLLTNPW
jgi:hypothetical protein